MHPDLVSIGPLTIHSFGVMLALAFLAGLPLSRWMLKRTGTDPNIVYTLLIGAIIGGLVGSKVHYLIINPDRLRLSILDGSGLVWYGGLVGGAIGVFVAARLIKARQGVVWDAIAPGLALGYAVGRVGCLLNGDDYGKPSSLPWAMSFPQGSPPTTDLVHPTQIYESLASLVILGLVLLVLMPRLRRPGSLFAAYLVLAGVERFLVEFVRTNPPALLGLTQQQWISVGLIVAGLVALWGLEYRTKPQLHLVDAHSPTRPGSNPSGRRERRRPSEGGK